MDITTTLIGRQKEKEILLKALNSSEPEMVAIIGRRRVGKTFLIRSVYENRIDFQLTGHDKETCQAQRDRGGLEQIQKNQMIDLGRLRSPVGRNAAS